MDGEETRVLGKSLIFGALAAVALAGCQTTRASSELGEIVTVQYDPNNYDQTRTAASAQSQCRAKGYASATPYGQQPTNRQGWAYKTFACIG